MILKINYLNKKNMEQETVYIIAKWQVKPGQLPAVLDLLAGVAESSRQEKGNLSYKVHQSQSDPNTIVLFESYANAAAMEEHRNSAHFQKTVVGRIVPLLQSREVTVASELILTN